MAHRVRWRRVLCVIICTIVLRIATPAGAQREPGPAHPATPATPVTSSGKGGWGTGRWLIDIEARLPDAETFRQGLAEHAVLFIAIKFTAFEDQATVVIACAKR